MAARFECVGHDPRGVPRVWGRGLTPQEAREQALLAARQEVSVRRDLGPLTSWYFEASVVRR